MGHSLQGIGPSGEWMLYHLQLGGQILLRLGCFLSFFFLLIIYILGLGAGVEPAMGFRLWITKPVLSASERTQLSIKRIELVPGPDNLSWFR